VSVGGDAAWDLRRPQDFDQVSRLVSADDMHEIMPISPDAGFHVDWIGRLFDLGIDELHLHQVARDQSGFIDFFGQRIIPQLRR
jgi:hypothetical protein